MFVMNATVKHIQLTASVPAHHKGNAHLKLQSANQVLVTFDHIASMPLIADTNLYV